MAGDGPGKRAVRAGQIATKPEIRVIFRSPDHTEMQATTDGRAKAFTRQLIRDGKNFECARISESEGWLFTVQEINHPSRWEAM